ncbi:MAG: PAS domain S-box protein [Anaerolineales bacterium]|nr:PAS domain S-box protein [Anaerolineales bacterium]
MSFQTILYLTILTVATVISMILALYTLQRRQTAGAKPFSLMMLALFEWSLAYLLQISSPDLAAQAFWNKATYFGIVTTPILWFLFSLEYTERKSWITRARLIGLFIFPVITLFVIWTNDAHYWFWMSDGKLVQEGDVLLRSAENGLWFWALALYSYLFILAGTVMVVRALLHWPSQYRGQMFWILLAVFAPWIFNIIQIFKLLPIVIDLTPFAFTLTGVGMAFALFMHHLLDLAPIAREVIIEGMQDGVIVLDSSSRIVETNKAIYSILNIPESQTLVGKKFADAIIQWPKLVNYAENASKTEAEISLGTGVDQSWVGLSSLPLQDKENNNVGRLIIIRDITSRKKAEEQVRKLSRAIESSPTSIVITGVDGNIQYVNPKFTQVTGYSFDEALGKKPNILKTDQTPVSTYNDLWKTISEGREWSGEFCNRKKNGELYWELASISPIYDDDGVITHYVAVKEDITERKHAQDALSIAYDQALEASRVKSQLLAKVSHELRTPLGGILGYAELLRDGALGEIKEEQKDAAKSILQSTEHLTTMVNELLDEAQIQANTVILKEKTYSPATLLEQATSGFAIMAEKKGLGFSTFIDPSLPRDLYGDEQRLRQILINLIGNAIKFTQKGEVRVRLERHAPEHWTLQVTDTGMGISNESQAYIFEPFRQVHNDITHENRGIGLGLSITKQLVELMGGRIILESKIGQGSSFSVLLPLKLPSQKM